LGTPTRCPSPIQRVRWATTDSTARMKSTGT